MNTRQFSEALGNVRGEYIAEAANYRAKHKNRNLVKRGILAACLCLAVAGGAGAFCYQLEHPYPVKKVITHPVNEIYIIHRWEDLKIYEQYTEIPVGDRCYTARRGEIPQGQIGEKLGRVTANGWDEYASFAGEDAARHLDAWVYEIAGISPECAVAVRYDGTNTYYSAVNSAYRPETIGQMIADLNLRDTLVFDRVYYEFKKPISGTDVTVCFEHVDSEKVWAMLLSNPDAINEYDETAFWDGKEIFSIAVDVPLLGYENISISAKENGYITTNILDTGKMFYVGEKNIRAFADYVLKECEGYEIDLVEGRTVFPE